MFLYVSFTRSLSWYQTICGFYFYLSKKKESNYMISKLNQNTTNCSFVVSFGTQSHAKVI